MDTDQSYRELLPMSAIHGHSMCHGLTTYSQDNWEKNVRDED